MRVWIMAGLAGVVLTVNLAAALKSEAAPAVPSTTAAVSQVVSGLAPQTAANFTQQTAPNTQPQSAVKTEPQSASQSTEDETGVIPNQAVRLRIIANSDAEEDQNLKRQLRDRVIADVGVRLRGVTSQEQARTILQAAVPELNDMATAFVRDKGYTYNVQTNYGMVPFPTKMYGNQVYPAGDYEALRIVLGSGQGQNWWCVLFPPLCFVDIANGDAVQAKDMETKPVATLQVPAADAQMAQTVQIRLGFLDLLQSLFKKIAHLLESI